VSWAEDVGSFSQALEVARTVRRAEPPASARRYTFRLIRPGEGYGPERSVLSSIPLVDVYDADRVDRVGRRWEEPDGSIIGQTALFSLQLRA
jgi:hypothetical protein